jgi:hypothetical protein
MEKRVRSKGHFRWVSGFLLMGAALVLFACGQEGGGQAGDLSKKAPPSLGAIAEVDGSDDAKKDGTKPKADAGQAPAQSPAGQAPAAAPKP